MVLFSSIINFIPLVNSDLPHILIFINSLFVVNKNFLLAIILMSLSLTIRIQTFGAILIFIFFYLVIKFLLFFTKRVLLKKNETIKNKKIIYLFSYSLILAFFLNIILLYFSKVKESILFNNRATFYYGFLYTDIKKCGFWDPEINIIIKNDIDNKISLFEVFKKRLKERSKNEIFNIIKCKIKKFFILKNDGYYWLFSSSISKRENLFLKKLENFSYIFLKILCLLFFIYVLKRKRRIFYFTLVFFLSFITLHIISEIQGRYFLEPFIFSLFLNLLLIKKT